MGYDNNECVFCYLKGYGNNRVDGTAACCFSCIDAVSLGATYRVASGLNSLSCFEIISECEVCGDRGERLGLHIPICDGCCDDRKSSKSSSDDEASPTFTSDDAKNLTDLLYSGPIPKWYKIGEDVVRDDVFYGLDAMFPKEMKRAQWRDFWTAITPFICISSETYIRLKDWPVK